MSLFTDASLVVKPSLYKTSKLYSIKPGTGLGDLSVVRNGVKWGFGPNGVLRQVAANVPLIEYDPVTRVERGLLVEPGGTNSIRNNTMVGAVVGTPGTLPTNYGEALQGLTRQVIGTGSEIGVEYIDVRFNGTATASADVSLIFESNTQIVATNGQTWTNSFFIKKVAEPNAPNDYRMTMEEWTDAAGFIKSASQTIVPTTTLTRFVQTRALDGGGTVARVRSLARFNVTNGNTYDFTVRIGLPQMEQSPVATSVMKTSGSTFNRVADVVSLTGASSLIGQTQGTLYAEVQITNFTQGQIFSVNDATASNRIQLYKFTDSKIYADRISATQSALTSIGTAVLSAGIYKVAFAYKTGDSALFVNGVQVGSTITQTFTFGSMGKVNIGSRFDNTQTFNDHIRSAVLFPTRKSNAELALLTQ